MFFYTNMNKTFIYSLLLFPLFALACESDPTENPNGGNSPLETMQLRDGITRISDDSLAFVLFAPGKNSVYLVGDFNSWQVSAPYKLHKDGDRFWLKIGDLDVSKEYVLQYVVDENIRIADPYSGKIIERNNNNAEPAMVVSTKQNNYDWKITNYTVSDPAKLVIYEILIRDFTEKRTIKGVQEKLPYLKALGINAIELMPFNEFEGSDGWGYNPSFYFAPESAYGTANDYKEFIDACHENGMAVIMDMVLNHSYGQSPLVKLYQKDGTITADNPWYNVKSPNTAYSWGYDFNHESPYTQAFVDSVNAYWLGEYKIDGYRFDFTKGFTNKSGDGQAFDQSRINILKRMTSEIWKHKHDAIVIFEHLADNSEEKVLADHGILLWGNLNYNMNEATMGWGAEPNNGSLKGDISWASYKQRGRANAIYSKSMRYSPGCSVTSPFVCGTTSKFAITVTVSPAPRSVMVLKLPVKSMS
ncbi:hypothetical protein AGMMS4957_20960 [Bacteroidia bacterium]|nr:hypothetical protein AGMMS4957_20960 [Bacteroidia bacterium]